MRREAALLLLPEVKNSSAEFSDKIKNSRFLLASELRQLRGLLLPTNYEKLRESTRYRKVCALIDKLQCQIWDRTEMRNSDLELTRSALAARANKIEQAKQFLETRDTIQMLFLVDGIGYRVGGIVGRAMLMIEALLHELPNATIHVQSEGKAFSAAGATFGSPANGRLTMGQFSTDPLDRSTYNLTDLTVSVEGGRPSMRSDPVPIDLTLYPFAHTQELGSLRWLGADDCSELTPILHASPVSNDLHSPRGTVILDRSLYRARKERESWDLAQFKQARRSWRRSVMDQSCNQALEHLARTEGWNVDEAIWSMCYLWDTDKMTRELRTLARLVRDNPKVLPSDKPESLPHLVIHTRVTTWGYFEQMFRQLTTVGVRTIVASAPHQPILNPAAPSRITLIAHDAIDNNFMRRALSQLTGCAVRDSNNTHWIDFPVYVTGSASWLESLSAGAITLHDDMDTSFGAKRDQIASLLLKKRILAGEHFGDIPWTRLHSRALSEAAEHIIGNDPTGLRYLNLAELSAQARAFTDSLYAFNSVDDLIIALADKMKLSGH